MRRLDKDTGVVVPALVPVTKTGGRFGIPNRVDVSHSRLRQPESLSDVLEKGRQWVAVRSWANRNKRVTETSRCTDKRGIC